MHTDYEHSREEDICTDTVLLLNTIRKEDLSGEAAQKKELIFKRIEQKINEREVKSIPFHTIKKYAAVSVLAIFLISTAIGYGFYRLGLGKGQSQTTQAWVTVRAPRGTTAEVMLPDQSKVILNAESSISYPSFFLNKREASLQGEGYFEIVSDSSNPFLLNTKLLSVKVLGTRFNMRSYPDDIETFVTLEEGFVEVCTNTVCEENLNLTPGQQLTFNHGTGELRREMVDTESLSSWRNGHLIFRDVPLYMICRELERRFNVQVQITDPGLGNESYYAVYKNGESLETILDLLSYKRNWNYKMEGQTVQIITH